MSLSITLPDIARVSRRLIVGKNMCAAGGTIENNTLVKQQQE